jgi:WD40 repeat protein
MSLAMKATSVTKSVKKDTYQNSPDKPKPNSLPTIKATGHPSMIPQKDRYNPFLVETFEASGSNLSCLKTFKGHLMGVSSLSYNPKKDILATGSDDSTWKLWSVPNGELIMSGEGHIDWIGGLDFHPRGNLLATASGDGTVKVWDFVNACCAHTFTEHG